jgi:hypothetical protein
MDGEMQKHYVHGVPRKNTKLDKRVAIVFRHGKLAFFQKDSGRTLTNVNPREAVMQVFGHVSGIQEGICYSRSQLRNVGAHM